MRLATMVLAVVCLAGCQAHVQPRSSGVDAANAAAVPKRTKLAVLKVESDRFPDVAQALNNLLHDVQVKGVDDYFISKVTLEVVQLSIECVEQTPACVSAAGKSLSAQLMLTARITAGPLPRKVRRRDRPTPPVNVEVTLYQVDSGTPIESVQKHFKNAPEALQGLSELVQQAIASPTEKAQPAVKTGKPTAKAEP